jgi:thiamine biosynthesis lipoprotein
LHKSNRKPKARNQVFAFEAIGTHWTIEINQPVEHDMAQDVLQKIHDRIEIFDQHYSRFRSDSLVSQMARVTGGYKLPADAQPLLDLYARVYTETNGTVTPLVGQLLSDAGYDADYSLQPKQLQNVPAWQEALDYQFPRLTLKQPVLLDFGAAGKGYLVDIIGELLQTYGVDSFYINAGGDILQHNAAHKTVDIGLENPDNLTQVIGVAKVCDQSLCGSAGNRRAWGDFHHIIDPHKRASPQHIKAVWVAAKTALLADMLTTALFFVPPDVLARSHEFEYAIVYADRSLTYSAHFPAHFFN